MNKFAERALIALAIVLCTFFSWIVITRAGIFDGGLEGEGARPDAGGGKEDDDGGKGLVAVYFANSVDTSAETVDNYWADEELSTPAGEIPDFSTVELHIVSGAQFDGDAYFINDGRNDGTVNGNATFVDDGAENYGIVTGTQTRLYLASLETTRDFSANPNPWIVTADGSVVTMTGATYDGTTIFTRNNGGYFISDFAATSASVTGTTLALTYNKTLDVDITPRPEAYAVTVNSQNRGVTEVAINGSQVLLSLAGSTITDEDAVTVSYTFDDNFVVSSQGLNALSFSNMSVEVIIANDPSEDGDSEEPQDDEEEQNNEEDQNNDNNQQSENNTPNTPSSVPIEILNINNTTQTKVQTKSSTSLSAKDVQIGKLTKEATPEKTVTKLEAEKSAVPSATNTSTVKTTDTPATNTVPVVTSPVLNAVKGKVLLSVEDKGRMWYVPPTQNTRYEISSGNALNVFRNTSLGITNQDLNKIPVAGTQVAASALGKRLTGRFLLQVENKGQTWYVDAAGYRHKVTIQNIVDVTKQSSLGITNQDLNQIPQTVR